MAHYYERTPEGVEARHFIAMTSRPDELRPTRITDVRKWWKNGQVVVPSVTTVLDVLNKWGLNNWRVDQHINQAWKHGNRLLKQCGTPDEFVAEVKRLTELEMDKAPSAGTDVHKSLEDYMEGREPASEHEEICENVMETLRERCGDIDWRTEVRFVSDMGYGGCADLVAADGSWVIDYKSKQLAKKFKPGKMVFAEHHMQLGAYRVGLSSHARAANIFVCLEDGQVDFHEHTDDELLHGLKLFTCALEIWQLQNGNPIKQARKAA